MTETTLIQAVSAERLQSLLQSMGYRVTVSENAGLRQLLSASQGIGFSIRPGNPAPAEDEFIDYTLSCALRVQGELPEGVVEGWNIGKRFARLTWQGPFLVLEKDVIVAGGVSENHLRAATELWDRLLQEFILFLREHAASRSPSASDAAAPSVQAEAAAVPEDKAAEDRDVKDEDVKDGAAGDRAARDEEPAR